MMMAGAEARPPGHVLRHIATGDVWRYGVEGSITQGALAQSLSGTIEVSVASDTLSNGACALMLVFAQSLRAGHDPLPPFTGIFSFVQDLGTGDLLIVADNMGESGQGRIADRPQVFYPGRWMVGTRYGNRLEFGGGAFVRNTLTVVGQEEVVTPLGAFPTWVARISSEGSAMGRLSGTDWWAPELGAPVRFETHSRLPGGNSMVLRATLNAANLANRDAT